MQLIEQAIWEQALAHPEKVAVKSGKDEATYSQLTSRILAAKDMLQNLPGYEEGRSIILAAGKQIEFLYVYFGAHLANLIVAPIDAETNPTRFEYITDAIDPFCVIGFEPPIRIASNVLTLKVSFSFFHPLPV